MDRVRETLFNVLGQFLSGEAVLDLYSGTGALSLEALSRGAGSAVLVEKDREMVALCQRNAAALGFTPQVTVMLSSVEKAVDRLSGAGKRFDLIFADPPYASLAGKNVLLWVDSKSLLAQHGTLVLEHDKRELLPEVEGGLTRVDERVFGDTRLSLYRKAD